MYEWFQKKGISRIQLRVAIGNRAGYSFWKKQGFEECIHILYCILE
ncbi:MAG: hypothetical protein HXS47_11815 [Theionarchaea archaeon]|nr:hypothetical protein [Theionarchaea archaeon]